MQTGDVLDQPSYFGLGSGNPVSGGVNRRSRIATTFDCLPKPPD